MDSLENSIRVTFIAKRQGKILCLVRRNKQFQINFKQKNIISYDTQFHTRKAQIINWRIYRIVAKSKLTL